MSARPELSSARHAGERYVLDMWSRREIAGRPHGHVSSVDEDMNLIRDMLSLSGFLLCKSYDRDLPAFYDGLERVGLSAERAGWLMAMHNRKSIVEGTTERRQA